MFKNLTVYALPGAPVPPLNALEDKLEAELGGRMAPFADGTPPAPTVASEGERQAVAA